MKYLLMLLGLIAAPLGAATINADPSDYQTKLSQMNAGDTLQLAAGTYSNGLGFNGVHGSANAWYTVQGPSTGTATFEARSGANTVSLRDCSFIAIKDITIDGLNMSGIDAIKAEGYSTTPHTVHDILIEGCNIVNHGGSQQTVGISTKCPAWNWTIRNNEIIGAGTGMYLGNSNGDEPFIRGMIEGNRVYDSEGYCIQIKHQNNWPTGLGLPTGNGKTILRNNVLIKTSRASGSGDRPNLLLSGFPDSGDGANDIYEVYGNFIAGNPRESLVQASGRLAIYGNILVDAPDSTYAGIYIKTHQGKSVKLCRIYNNTIYDCGRGIRVASGDSADHVVGNLVFSGNAISGTVATQSDNLTDTVANAGNYVTNPSTTLGSMDFYPLNGQCTGSAIGMSAFSGDSHYDLDFNGDSRGSFTYRGAYAGSGSNPGWALDNGLKNGGLGSGPTTPPGLSVSAPAAGALPDAIEGGSYSVTFQASGGAGGYTFSIPPADVPPGLALNTGTGELSGVATTPAAYAFTVTVTDSASATAQAGYTLDVVVPGQGGSAPDGGSSGGGGCVAGGGGGLWLLALPALWWFHRRAPCPFADASGSRSK